MNRKPERKAEIPHSALHEQFRLGLVYNPGYLDKILNIHRYRGERTFSFSVVPEVALFDYLRK
jgi:hypothetical protein